MFNGGHEALKGMSMSTSNSNSEAYLEPSQTPTMEVFHENS